MLASPVTLGRKAMQPIQWLLCQTWEKISNAALFAETAERIAKAGMRPDRCRAAMTMRHPETDSALCDRDHAESRGIKDHPTFDAPLAASGGAV